jgi:hypothetical protein
MARARDVAASSNTHTSSSIRLFYNAHFCQINISNPPHAQLSLLFPLPRCLLQQDSASQRFSRHCTRTPSSPWRCVAAFSFSCCETHALMGRFAEDGIRENNAGSASGGAIAAAA